MRQRRSDAAEKAISGNDAMYPPKHPAYEGIDRNAVVDEVERRHIGGQTAYEWGVANNSSGSKAPYPNAKQFGRLERQAATDMAFERAGDTSGFNAPSGQFQQGTLFDKSLLGTRISPEHQNHTQRRSALAKTHITGASSDFIDAAYLGDEETHITRTVDAREAKRTDESMDPEMDKLSRYESATSGDARGQVLKMASEAPNMPPSDLKGIASMTIGPESDYDREKYPDSDGRSQRGGWFGDRHMNPDTGKRGHHIHVGRGDQTSTLVHEVGHHQSYSGNLPPGPRGGDDPRMPRANSGRDNMRSFMPAEEGRADGYQQSRAPGSRDEGTYATSHPYLGNLMNADSAAEAQAGSRYQMSRNRMGAPVSAREVRYTEPEFHASAGPAPGNKEIVPTAGLMGEPLPGQSYRDSPIPQAQPRQEALFDTHSGEVAETQSDLDVYTLPGQPDKVIGHEVRTGGAFKFPEGTVNITSSAQFGRKGDTPYIPVTRRTSYEEREEHGYDASPAQQALDFGSDAVYEVGDTDYRVPMRKNYGRP